MKKSKLTKIKDLAHDNSVSGRRIQFKSKGFYYARFPLSLWNANS